MSLFVYYTAVVIKPCKVQKKIRIKLILMIYFVQLPSFDVLAALEGKVQEFTQFFKYYILIKETVY